MDRSRSKLGTENQRLLSDGGCPRRFVTLEFNTFGCRLPRIEICANKTGLNDPRITGPSVNNHLKSLRAEFNFSSKFLAGKETSKSGCAAIGNEEFAETLTTCCRGTGSCHFGQGQDSGGSYDFAWSTLCNCLSAEDGEAIVSLDIASLGSSSQEANGGNC